ncbi:ParA family protein [Sphingobium subterraneum]|uniref:Cellulose biosynthesis protein BcsQ n=1 Tax=Sphingobium subterraneum TaxID=627688 RepID=A0A841IYR6_9SPHN|nr:ParA family protein [Sphingobium subterraneum]MBB6123554.1 cellulose biosynthesis protein BcsQ [Sphingobium subterraneum]
MNKGDALATIAVYSLKGGVGKTTFAVNLAWAAVRNSSRRTLLWDLDPQAAATWMLSADKSGRDEAQAIFSKDIDVRTLIRPSTVPGIDLIAADTSLRGLDRLFFDLGKKKRLARLIEGLEKDYDRIILDCPPGLTETSEQVLRAADVIVVPVIPSPLSQRALGEVARYLMQRGGSHPPILPVYSMVDRRRSLHRSAMEENPTWPVVPMASAVEQMASRRKPIGEFAPSSPAAQQFAKLWQAIEKKLAKR